MKRIGTGNIGGKAANLESISSLDVNIPQSFVLSESIFDMCISSINEEIQSCLNQLDKGDVDMISARILEYFENINTSIINEHLATVIDLDTKYAVRSSGIQEDLQNHSFAGMYSSYLNITGINMVESVIECYKSLYSPRALAYHLQTGLPHDNYKMAVLVQEMINPEYSGVLFTSNTLEANDQEMYIEYIEGYGENLVSGLVNPDSITIPWFGDFSQSNIEHHLLLKLRHQGLILQQYYGYPVDVEFCINEDVHIVQVRAITSFDHSKFNEVWTNANFRDGLAKTPATPIMNSLYKYIWEAKYEKYLMDSKLIKREEITESYKIHMANAYWNISLGKKAMSKIIGYKERSFDEELGITATYDGDGMTVGVTPHSLLQIIKTAPRVKQIERNFEIEKQEIFNKYMEIYNSYVSQEPNYETIEEDFYRLTKKEYFEVEGTYYWQIFINTVRLSLFQDFVLKYADTSQYISLISNIEDISHLRPFNKLQDLTREIKQDQESVNFWLGSTNDQINSISDDRYHIKAFRQIVKEFGYHSQYELRLEYPNYIEDNSSLIKFVQTSLNSHPTESTKNYDIVLNELSVSLSKSKFTKLKKKTQAMRSALWWREEYKDLSTRYYHLIRIYGKSLANKLVNQNILECEDDLWFAEITDIWNYLDNITNDDEFRQIICNNKVYYNSYRNMKMPNELGVEKIESKLQGADYSGIGCSSGVATGEVCIINSAADLEKITKDVIVIANNLEPNFISKIKYIKGIVTESGGLLCHYAVVAREVNIPCVVNVHNILHKLEDRTIVTVDGSTGQVKIMEAKNE